MWMFDVELDDATVLNAYKHRWTRAYFHLADDATTFYYAGSDRYARVDPWLAVTGVFRDWDCIKPTLSERRALDAVIDRVRNAETEREAAD
jgi:hypothetical protein